MELKKNVKGWKEAPAKEPKTVNVTSLKMHVKMKMDKHLKTVRPNCLKIQAFEIFHTDNADYYKSQAAWISTRKELQGVDFPKRPADVSNPPEAVRRNRLAIPALVHNNLLLLPAQP